MSAGRHRIDWPDIGWAVAALLVFAAFSALLIWLGTYLVAGLTDAAMSVEVTP